MSKDHRHLHRVGKVDADAETDISEKYDIQGFPTFKIIGQNFKALSVFASLKFLEQMALTLLITKGNTKSRASFSLHWYARESAIRHLLSRTRAIPQAETCSPRRTTSHGRPAPRASAWAGVPPSYPAVCRHSPIRLLGIMPNSDLYPNTHAHCHCSETWPVPRSC